MTNGSFIDGQGFVANGSSSYMSFGDAFYSDTLTLLITWVAPASLDANARAILFKRNSSGGASGSLEYNVVQTNTYIQFGAWTTGGVTIQDHGFTISILPNSTYNICVVHRGSGKPSSIYINGVESTASAVASGSILNTTSHLQIAARTNNLDSRWGKGTFTNFHAWSIARTDGLALSKNPWQIFAPRRQWFALGSAATGIDLSADAQSSASATGTITQAVTLTGASVALATATGVVNQTVSIAGSAASISVANGVAMITTTLAGNGFVESFASGTLASALALDTHAESSATMTGTVGLTMSLSATAIAQALASADLDSGQQNVLSGNAQASTGATGSIMQSIPVLGDAVATVNSAAGLSNTHALSGTAVVSALANGDLQITGTGLSAAAIADVIAGGSITIAMPLDAAALAQAQAIGTLTVADLWSGTVIEKYTLRAARNYVMTGRERNYRLMANA
jgi:hypothetical protein